MINFQSESEELEFYKKLAKNLCTSGDDMNEAFRIVRDNIDPWRGFKLEGNGSNRKAKDILSEESCLLNDHARKSMMICGSGISQGTMPKISPWIKLTLDDEDRANFWSVRAWLDEYGKRMHSLLARSNGYAVAKEGNLENILFGTEATIIENDWEDGLNFIGHTAGEYSIGYGHKRKVEFLHRRVLLNVWDIVSRWGKGGKDLSKLSSQIKNDWSNKEYFKEHFVQHLIMPAPSYNYGAKDKSGFRYQSIYFLDGEGQGSLLEKGGFRSRPFVAPRPWGIIPGSVWGYGPGFWAVGNSRQLQMLELKKLKGVDKQVDPSINAPDSLKEDGIDQTPGSVNWYPQGTNPDAIKPLMVGGIDLSGVSKEIREVEQRISAGFFNDFFLAILNADKTMTMFEVARRNEEKLSMVGPVLERMHEEKLVPMIERVAEIMETRGLVPPPPPDLPGNVPIKIEFISPLAQAQKLIGVTNLQQYVAFAGTVKAIDPQAVTRIDFGQILDDGAQSFAVNPKSIRSPEQQAEILNGAQQMQTNQMMLGAAKPLAEAAKIASETDSGDGKTVLQKIAANANR